MARRVGWALVALLPGSILAPSTSSAQEAPYRAFSADSYWNTPLPVGAPLHPNSAQIMEFIRADNTTNFVHISGTGSTGRWAQPVYWAKSGDPVYNVVSTRYRVPPEFASLRIPRGAQPDPTSDAEMTVYDLERGYVAGLYHAVYDSATDRWTAGGGEIFYLASNGIDGRFPQSNEPRNTGNHRGLPPPSYCVRYDEVQAGRVNHLLKIGINTTKAQAVFPMWGHENGTTAEYAPAEGARIRIKPSVDLSTLGLPAPALAVARSLQRYGAIIGDQTGGPVELKTENTIAEGRGQLWDGVLNASSLAAIPLSMYEVIEYGYIPPAAAAEPEPVPTPTSSPTPTPTASLPATTPSVTPIPTLTSSPVPAGTAPSAAPAETMAVSDIERSVIALMNLERQEAGVPQLRVRTKIRKVARRHSGEMASTGAIFHNEGLSRDVRHLQWSRLGENVGAGNAVEELHQAFMNSPPHRRNVLSRRFRSVGIGVVHSNGRIWVTADFLG